MILTYTLYFTLFCIGLSFILILIGIIKGPTLLDRIVTSDVLGILLLAFIIVLSILFKSQTYLSLAFLVALISFIGSIALSKFAEKGSVIDRE